MISTCRKCAFRPYAQLDSVINGGVWSDNDGEAGIALGRLLMIMLGRQGIREVTLVSRTPTRLLPSVGCNDLSFDIAHLREFGWVSINNAIPIELCSRLVHVLETEIGVPVHDPSCWDAYGGELCDFVPIWGHQAQWDIRQHPNLHHIWATLLGTERLCVSLDSCRFTPPWKPGYAEPYGIHWDHDHRDTDKRMFQGVLALTDTATDQGGFRCVPSLYRDRDAWPNKPIIDADGQENWLADITGREIVHVPAQAGDLLV
jgi:hypothetical protein